MKLDSKIFDKIRVKPDPAREQVTNAPRCAQAGCDDAGLYPAPKGRGREGDYLYFCLDHVREYNRTYNYFNGMSDEDVASYIDQNLTGHRPTKPMGVRGAQERFTQTQFSGLGDGFGDPFGFFRRREAEARARAEAARPVHNAERKARRALNLDDNAQGAEIKARYKELVKRHHPDANGGDRGSEDRLREIIQAYSYLKSAGFC